MHPPASYQTQLAVDLSTDSHRVWLSVPRVSFESARRVSFKSASTNAISGYLYDRLYRLTQVEDGNAHPLETYTYSKAGDRKSKTANGLATGTYGYTNHWLTSTGSEARTYDAAGNTTSNQVGGNTYNYAYDNANHLVQVQANGAVMADYTYNLNNERLSKTVGDNTDRYVYNEQSQLLSETGSAHRDYLWLDDLPIGVVDNGSTVNYLIADALNTPRVITAVGGATVWYWPIENNAFGEQQPIGSFTYNLRFPGQYCDAESGLFYNVHRYYEPLTGRYVQADPIGFASGQLSWYAYGNNNPLMYVDPYGLWDLPSIPQPVVDFSAGMGDTLSFGVTNWVRDQMGTNDVVDQCSTSYDAGEWAGIGTSTAIGGAAGWRAAGTKAAGKEFSHWIPNRMGGPRSLWNGNYVTPARHYYHDPFRYPSGWRSLGDKWPAGIQQFDRIPNVYKGAGAGAGLGGMGAAINGTY